MKLYKKLEPTNELFAGRVKVSIQAINESTRKGHYLTGRDGYPGKSFIVEETTVDELFRFMIDTLSNVAKGV